jgi:hypothetical protein
MLHRKIKKINKIIMEQTNQNPQIDPEVLRQAKQELESICQKHDIVLMPIVIHQGDRTISSIEIIPRAMMQQPPNSMVRTVVGETAAETASETAVAE